MKLKDAKLRQLYKVKHIELCEPCDLKDDGSCMILSLMTRGLVPGSDLMVVSKKLGMYELKIDGTHIIIRQPNAEKFNIEVE